MSSSLDDVKERIASAYKAFWSMQKIWKSKEIGEKIKLTIFHCTCFPICLYGCESWILNEKVKSKLNTFVMNCYRTILNIRKLDKIKNEDILIRVNKCSICKTVRLRQLNFLSKILNSNENTIAKDYLLYEPSHGKRKVGRPQLSYNKHIKFMVNKSLADLIQIIKDPDKKLWNSLINEDNVFD